MSKPNTTKLNCGFCVYVSICIAIIRSSIYTNGVRMRMMPCTAPCTSVSMRIAHPGEVRGVSEIVHCWFSGSQKNTTWLWSISSMHFLLFVLFLLSCFYGGLTSLHFSLSESRCQLHSALVSALHSAKYVHCEGPAVCLPRSPSPRNVLPTPSSINVFMYCMFQCRPITEGERKLTFLCMTANWHS